MDAITGAKKLIKALQEERTKAVKRIEEIDDFLGSMGAGSSPISGNGRRKRGKLSPETRKKMAAAARKRWRAARATTKKPKSKSKPKVVTESAS